MQSKVGPMGFGNGPVIAAGVMLGGSVLFAGWGVIQMAPADDPRVAAIEAPAGPAGGSVTVTMSDADRNGVADAPGQKKQEPPVAAQPVALKPAPAPKPEPEVYTIQPGDTLTAISAETDVPVGQLVEANRIQNPNLIYAGSALLIPPVA
ncbi:LysM peptidoglycan-binding domain-containing protein [Arthrobacter sp. NPDC056691]|uniref:LysM peptidoglycan-binding domain-containing protein n=1 Tax=Arthrobacter sp. NPDC056691 TaxID=3345913 RepID=UPI003672CA85